MARTLERQRVRRRMQLLKREFAALFPAATEKAGAGTVKPAIHQMAGGGSGAGRGHGRGVSGVAEPRAYGLWCMIMHMEDVSRHEKMGNGKENVNTVGWPVNARPRPPGHRIGYFRILVVNVLYLHISRDYSMSHSPSLRLGHCQTLGSAQSLGLRSCLGAGTTAHSPFPDPCIVGGSRMTAGWSEPARWPGSKSRRTGRSG
jgi:hypothetical protein